MTLYASASPEYLQEKQKDRAYSSKLVRSWISMPLASQWAW